MNIMCRPVWLFLLMYRSPDVRHTGFPQVDGGQRTPRFWGVTIIDATCCGAFKRRNAKEAKQLIEDLAKCNYKASSETSRSSSRLKGSGMLELNRMTHIEAKLDTLMSKMGNQERRMHSANEVGTVDENEKRNSTEERLAHEGPYQVKEAQYLHATRSYNFKPNLNLPTHYTPSVTA